MTSTSPPSPRIDMDAGQQQQPPAPPSTAPERPPLRRSTTDKMVGGVCGGLAEHTGIDSLVWRVGFVGFTLAGGAGILVYLLLWVLMPPGRPADEQQPGRLDRLDRLAGQAHEKVYATGWLPPRG
jgi:phage shock protein C